MEKRKKIIFVGGGTLGHVFPIIPVAKKLYQKYDLVFIGTINGLEKDWIRDYPFFKKKYFFDMQGLKRKLTIKNLVTLKKYFRCKKKIKIILKKEKPSLVIGMGGYISGVTLKAALSLNIRTIIHEQNSILGLGNKLVQKKVDKVLLSFPIKTKNKNTIIVGNPRISEIKKNGYEEDNRILIISGSRGSILINNLVLSCVNDFIENDFYVTLITGKRYYDENYKKIESIKSKNIEIISFTNNMENYLSKAGVVVSRSGATTLVEIMALNKVSILIPSPNVTKNHQEKNADILFEKNACFKILEKDLTKSTLINNLLILSKNKEKRQEIRNNLKNISSLNALDNFIYEVEQIL